MEREGEERGREVEVSEGSQQGKVGIEEVLDRANSLRLRPIAISHTRIRLQVLVNSGLHCGRDLIAGCVGHAHV